MCKAEFAGDETARVMSLWTIDGTTMPSIMVDTGHKDSYVKTKALIVESDSGMCKAGFAGTDTSRMNYPSMVCRTKRPRGHGTMEGMGQKAESVCNDARRVTSPSTLGITMPSIMVDAAQKDSYASDETLYIALRAMSPSTLSFMMPGIMDDMSQKDGYASDETLDNIAEIFENHVVQVEHASGMCSAGSASDESPRETRASMRTRLKRARQYQQAGHENAVS